METEISKAHFQCNKSKSPEIEENLKEILNECEEESHVVSEPSSTSSARTTTSDEKVLNKVDEESTILSTETDKDPKELSTTEINAMRKRIRFSSSESDSRFDDDEYKWLDFRLGDVPDGILRVPFPLYVDSGSDGSIDDFSDLDPTDLFADSLQGLEWAQRELAELQEAETRPVIPMYPHGPHTQTECFVCFEEVILRRRMCCKFPICDSCLESYLKVQVNQGTVKIECPNSDCQSYIHRDEIFARLPTPMKSKFYKFLIDANLDQCLKTCPRCSEALHVDRTVLKKRSVKKKGLLVECPNCSLEWCFTCHAPWHKGLSCKGFRKGDHLLKEWAREYHFGQINAQKCPKCKIFIQRDLGCDHMTCNRCGTEFCYRCGERYLGCKWLGNHLSRLSPFGCRYNFMPEKPHMRRIIRGSVLGGKLLGMMALSGFVVAAGAFLLGVGVIALPTWGAYKLHKRLKERRRSHPRIKRSKHPIIFIPSDPFFIRRTGGSGTRTDNSDLQISMDDRNDLRRVLFDFQLAGSQRVEVVVHQPVLSTGNQEDYEASGGTGDANSEPPIFHTDVQEVTDENGYTTIVTHFFARSLEDKSRNNSSGKSKDYLKETEENVIDTNDSDDEGKEQGDSRAAPDSYKKVIKMPTLKLTSEFEGPNPGGKVNERSHEHLIDRANIKQFSLSASAKDSSRKLDGENVPESKEHTTLPNSHLKEKLEKDRKKGSDHIADDDPTPPESPDLFAKESTNGCFGNIFAKKLSSLQISTNHSYCDPTLGLPRMHWQNKSATWEKSQLKGSSQKPEHRVDIFNLEQLSEKPTTLVADIPKQNCGVQLQDCVVLLPPGSDGNSKNWSGSDNLSLSSSSSEDDSLSIDFHNRIDLQSESFVPASNSFHGSNLSCDIVTYL